MSVEHSRQNPHLACGSAHPCVDLSQASFDLDVKLSTDLNSICYFQELSSFTDFPVELNGEEDRGLRRQRVSRYEHFPITHCTQRFPSTNQAQDLEYVKSQLAVAGT